VSTAANDDATRDGYAALLGRPGEQLELRRGQSADVVIDLERDEVWRFPRTPDALARMDADVERLEAARAGGLPAPQVLEVAAGPAGTARVRMTRLAGTPLTDCPPLSDAAAHRLAGDLATALEWLRRLPLPGWADDDGGWAEHWGDLRADATRLLLPRMSEAGRAVATAQLERAAARATSAPISPVHGDLGAAHLFVDPATGALQGIADWDTLGPGDPVVDLAALRATLPAPVLQALLALRSPSDDEQDRMAAYAGTFALQDALLSARADDWEAADEALAAYV
jgi:aminoglycoside phosphotransferase (APT) family kinase protein